MYICVYAHIQTFMQTHIHTYLFIYLMTLSVYVINGYISIQNILLHQCGGLCEMTLCQTVRDKT